MDENNGAGLCSESLLESRKINLPAVVVDHWVRYQLHVLQIAQKIEQWIARLRNQDFVFGVAKEPEDVGIAFAGAGGENNILWIDFAGGGARATFVVLRYGLSGAAQAFRLGIVIEGFGISECIKNGVFVVVKTSARGV